MQGLHGLYAITDNTLIKPEYFVETVEHAIIGGANIIQYRDKTKNDSVRFKQAKALRILCHQYKIPLIINDDVALAQRIQADGVHLGKLDTTLDIARSKLGSQAIIGISCYNQLSLAQDAVKAGATYVAFGRFFNSKTKPQAVSCSIDLLRQARPLLKCPVVAIGGITPENAPKLLEAGADCLAVIHGIFGQTNVTMAAQAFN